ncbi:hypothetical protein NA78x_001089 [Anatilimnocola sp. NA78]|uniref:hypothetical protein n=1 Tax=Anatilimnocola sp. NA78 TaxID=3415683 RepID=UPI003CE54E70
MKRRIYKQLRSHVGTGEIVRIERSFPGEPVSHGFVVALSSDLLMLHQFHDFSPDGHTVLRVGDVSDVRSGEYERQWEKMLAGEGIPIDFSSDLPITDMATLADSLLHRSVPVIIHCEDKLRDLEDFYIGNVLSVDGANVSFVSFDALGKWDKEPLTIPIGDITRWEIDTTYATKFSKYLEGPCPFIPSS